MKKEKRGQFYLIAAIIIIVVLFGVTAVTNYIITKPDSTRYWDLSQELELESEYVVNYGIIREEEIKSTLERFSKDYTEYISSESEVYFVFGNQEKIWVVKVEDQPVGEISLTMGGRDVTIEFVASQATTSKEIIVPEGGTTVEVKVGRTKYPFKLKQGNNFFFVIGDELKGEPSK